MEKPEKPNLKGYRITKDQVELYRSFIFQRDEIHQVGKFWSTNPAGLASSLWWKHSLVFSLIIAMWFVHRSEEYFLYVIADGIISGGFGGIILGYLTSYLHKKYRDNEIRKLQNLLIPNMDVVTVRRYIDKFDKYQSDLRTYEYLKSQKQSINIP